MHLFNQYSLLFRVSKEKWHPFSEIFGYSSLALRHARCYCDGTKRSVVVCIVLDYFPYNSRYRAGFYDSQ